MKLEVADVSCVVAEGQLIQAAFAHLKLTADLIHNTAHQNVIAFSSNLDLKHRAFITFRGKLYTGCFTTLGHNCGR
jgi:hypothetical protein